jgi:integral membrane protein
VPALPFRLFRLAAFAEAVSWTGLLIGMVFKYLVVKNEIGVKVFGPIHGVLFLCYLAAVLALWTAIRRAGTPRWGRGVLVLGILASIPPFGTLVFERWAVRRAPDHPVAGPAEQAVARSS